MNLKSLLVKKSTLSILLISTVGLLSITWFRGNFLVNQGDQLLPLSPIREFIQTSLFTWDQYRGTGFVVPPGLANNFYYGLMAVFELIGFNLVVSEKLLYYLMFTGSGISMYFLIRKLSTEKRELTKLFASFAYMFSFYPLLVFWIGLPPLGLFYAFLPLILLLFINSIEAVRFSTFPSLLLILAISTITFPTYLVVLTVVFATYCFVALATKTIPPKNLVRLVPLSIIYLLLNNWWIVPFASSFGSFLQVGRIDSSGDILGYLTSKTQILNVLRLLGYPTFASKVTETSNFPWAAMYLKQPLLSLSFIIPIIGLLGLVSDKDKNNKYLYLVLSLVCIFFIKGFNVPFSYLAKAIYDLPLFGIFRNPYEKFGGVLSLSLVILATIGFSKLLEVFHSRYKRYTGVFITLVFVSCFGVYMWPYWSGDVIRTHQEGKPSALVKIPADYYAASKWISRDMTDYRLLSLPHQEGAAYDWEYGYVGSADPALQLLNKPLLSPFDPNDQIMSPYLDRLFQAFSSTKDRDLQNRLLGSSNVKYVLLHRDVNFELNTPDRKISVDDIDITLKANSALIPDNQFGPLSFFRVDDKYFFPHIYITDGNINLQSINTQTGRQTSYYQPKITDENEATQPDQPTIIFQKINGTKYRVLIHNATRPYTLVFSETFNKYWRNYLLYDDKAAVTKVEDNRVGDVRTGKIIANYFDGQIKEGTHKNTFLDKYTFETWGEKPIPEDRHIMANGYANSWYITLEDAGGKENYEIIIEFLPQRYFYIGLAISLTTFACCLVYLGFDFIKGRRKNRDINSNNK